MLEDRQLIVLGALPSGEVAWLAPTDRRRHLYLIGKTGTGKSTLLFNLMNADAESGRGFALLDPHGDLAVAIADSLPPERNDVIYIDPADLAFAAGFNPLHAVAPDQRALVTAHIVAAFRHIWGNSWGPRLEYILTEALRLLLDTPGTTLLGLPRLLVDDGYRERLLKQARDSLVRTFWQSEFANYPERLKAEAVAPLQNKIGTLLSAPAIRNMLGQPRSTLNLSRIMDRGQMLIVNLAKGRLGEAPAHLLGALLVTGFAQAAAARANQPEQERRDFTLYADEFQNFATDSFAGILSEARKYRLSLVLAHQFLGQLPLLLRQAVFGNAGSMVVFRVGAEDAPLLAAELGLANAQAVIDTGNFKAWTKLMRDGQPLDAHVLATFPSEPGITGRFAAVRARSRARHCRPREAVENRITRFLSG